MNGVHSDNTVPAQPLNNVDSVANGLNGNAIKSAQPYASNGVSAAPGATQQQPIVPTSTQNGDVGVGHAPQVPRNLNEVEVVCGPLLNYRRMSGEKTETPTWHGSVLIVASPGGPAPELQLVCVGPAYPNSPGGQLNTQPRTFGSQKLYEDPVKAFWRFTINLPIQAFEAKWEYSISPVAVGSISNKTFVVQSKSQSMRIMFHSCNGFSVGTDVDAWSGPALWNDVLRMHGEQPFHVMIGGGDQIYNDGVRVDGPLKPWTDISNPHKRREFPFGEQMRAECDEYYFKNYVRWYGQEPFKTANCAIPQLNIWDDHDIIDGFGSYTDRFMRCAVFRGIGGVAHKYYLLFQHHLAPPKSTFTTDAPKTTHVDGVSTAADPAQLAQSWVLTGDVEDPSYIMGSKPGPYVEERSRNMYCQLGKRMAFVGLDARTERTRHQVNYPETYDLLFARLEKELGANQDIKHLILLLGVPIAYPRLQWLENIFSSPLIAPLRILNKRFGFGGNFFNSFDGQIDLLDDLDDHYTAHHHKRERKVFVERLQALAKAHSVRITILGGDVHLAAMGRFYSNPKLGIPVESDWRYMANIISSAITNKPPPTAVANLLARRNKVHHLDHETDETLLEMFDRDPGMHKEEVKERTKTGEKGPGKKSADSNHATMPSRNYAIIAESRDWSGPVPSPVQHHGASSTTSGNGAGLAPTDAAASAQVDGAAHSGPGVDEDVGFKIPSNPRLPLHRGEEHAGTLHPAASGLKRTGLGGEHGLDVTIRVEISNKDREGNTEGYGLTIPGLDCKQYAAQGSAW